MQLDIAAAQKAIQPIADKLKLSIEQAAAGIISIANEHMAHALRVMSVQRGIDPGELTLVSFEAMVPRYAGVLSALGMLVAPRARQLSQTFTHVLNKLSDKEIQQRFALLLQQGIFALKEEGVAEKDIIAEYSLDCRYLGQSYFLNVKWKNIKSAEDEFQKLHKKRYGHQLDLDVELVNIRLALKSKVEEIKVPLIKKNKVIEKESFAKLEGIEKDVSIFNRDNLSYGEKITGPALITETVSTTYLAPGWICEVDKSGCLMLKKAKR